MIDFEKYKGPATRLIQSPATTIWCALRRIDTALEVLTATQGDMK